MTLEIQNASARAGGREIVHNLDLALAAGEIVAVVGPNGAGKSTLLKLACGLMPLHGGEIRFDGSKIGSLSAGELSRRRALLPQECPMRARFTALELVLMGTAISGQGRPMAERVAIAQDTLDRVGLSSFMERDIMTLSGGERQRVHLARVLAQLEAAARNGAPGCLLLDEPLSAQDMARQRLILQIAKMHAAHGGSVLLVLHDLNWAAACADRIVVMHQGRIQSHGLPRDILTSKLLHDVFGIPDGCIHQHCSTGRPFVVPHDLVMPEDINKRETMYIAMNRFKVRPDSEDAFRQRWLEREVLLKTVPGFVSFQFLQGPAKEDHVLYASHTVWESYEAFVGWTQSEQFRAAHAGAGQGKVLTVGPPVFEGFKVLQNIEI